MPAIQQEKGKFRGELVSFAQRTADGWGTGLVLVRGKKAAPSDFMGSRDKDPFAFDDDASNDDIPITGKLLGARVGDEVEIEGVWVDHAKYGRQFKLYSITSVRPDGPDGAVRWMASRFPEVGESRALELVQKFGEQLWDIIEKEPMRLTEVNGITEKRALAISAAYKEVAGERDHMIKLRGWGLTDGQVNRCVERWKNLDAVVAELQRNPYLLSQEVFGFGFIKADAVARAMGIRKDAPERIAAGVEHVVGEAGQNGHCYLWGGALQNMSAELLGVSPSLIGPQIIAAAKADRLVRRGARVYPKRLDVAEEAVADAIREWRSMRQERAA